MSGITRYINDIHHGDAAATLRNIPNNSVHMAMCSPPYYGQHSYEADGQISLDDDDQSTLPGTISSEQTDGQRNDTDQNGADG